jgi:O-antigen/teichoic acid export membrane protein
MVGIAGAIKLLLSVFYLMRLLDINRFAFDIGLFKEQLIYSFPLGLNGVVAILAKGLNKLFIAAFFSAAQYAIYANGAIEIPIVPIIMSSTVAVLVPELSRHFADKNYRMILDLWHLAIRKVSVIILPIFVLFWVLAEEIIITLFSEKYIDSAIYFRIFLLMLPLRCFLETPLLMAGNRTRRIFYGALADVIFNFILGYYLVQNIGIKGPAITIVIATFLQICYYLWEAKRLLPGIPLKQFLPYGDMFIIFLISIVSGIGAYFARDIVSHTFATLIISSAAFATVGATMVVGMDKIFKKNIISRIF